MEKTVTRDQMNTILEGRPKGVSGKEIIDTYIANGYKIEGINYEKPTENQTLGSKLMDRAKTLGSEVAAIGTLGASTLKPEDIAMAKGDKTQQDALALQGGLRAAQAPIRAVGAVGGALGDVIGAGLSQIGVDKAIGGVISPVLQNEQVKKAVDLYNTLPQDTKDVLGAIVNTTNLAGTGELANIAKIGTKGAINVAKDVSNTGVETAGKLLSKTNPTEAQAISNTYKGIMDLVENKKSLLNSFKKSEGSGKDPISLISENPDYMVKINPEAKTIDAADAITNMRRDIADFSTVRDSLLATADETLPAIPTNKIIKDALTKFSTKNYSTYLDEGEKAVKDIVTKLQTLKKYNPETVSRVELNNIRKALDETINSFTDTKLKDRMRADLRSVFKNNLEQSIPESGLLADLNSKIGDLLDASNFLEKSLNGTKVKGGGLTDLAMKATGAAIGATGLGGAVGGIPGAIGGYFLSDFLSKTLIKNAINNPFDRAILEKLKSVRPEVVKRAEDYIKGSSPSGSPLSPNKLLQESQVPSTKSTPSEIKSKGIRGMVNPSELLPKKKVSSLEQEAKKYKSAEEFSSMENKAEILKEKFNKTQNGDDLRAWRKAQNEVENYQYEMIKESELQDNIQQRKLDEKIRKSDISVDKLSEKDIDFLSNEAKKVGNLKEFISKVRGSATQYGEYAPKLRKYVRPNSVFVGDIKGLNPNTKITVYRGIDSKSITGKQIRNGDFVTTDFNDALSYTDSPSKVVSKEVRLKDLIEEYPEDIDITNPLKPVSYELIYNSTGKMNKITDSKLTDIWNKANKK